MARSSIQFASVVTAAGTAVALDTETHHVVSLLVHAGRAAAANTGTVYVGDSNVDASSAKGLRLEPGDTWEPDISTDDPWIMSDIFVDADTTSDGVTGLYRLV